MLKKGDVFEDMPVLAAKSNGDNKQVVLLMIGAGFAVADYDIATGKLDPENRNAYDLLHRAFDGFDARGVGVRLSPVAIEDRWHSEHEIATAVQAALRYQRLVMNGSVSWPYPGTDLWPFVQTVLATLGERAQATAYKRAFPYEDSRRLRAALAEQFQQHAPEGMFNANLNEHLTLIAGVVAGGLGRYDPARRSRLTHLLALNFFERYPQYQFLEAVDLAPYPALQAALQFAEQFRVLLLEMLDVTPSAE